MPYQHQFSSGQHCAVYGCTYNQKKRNVARKQLCETHAVLQEECGCNIYLLHRFPADRDLRRRWIVAVNRKDFFPTESSRVCSQHFVDGRRTERNPVPMLRLGYEKKVLKGRRRIVRHEVELPKRKDEGTIVTAGGSVNVHLVNTDEGTIVTAGGSVNVHLVNTDEGTIVTAGGSANVHQVNTMQERQPTSSYERIAPLKKDHCYAAPFRDKIAFADMCRNFNHAIKLPAQGTAPERRKGRTRPGIGTVVVRDAERKGRVSNLFCKVFFYHSAN
ncbi:uncharacterized protein LOC144133318 isoform X2 [Amblyomma americanum]